MKPPRDGQSALDIIASRPIDLVLLDVMMPGISGLDVLKEIRKSLSRLELPVIMVTALNESFDAVEALSIGANDYITKPIDFRRRNGADRRAPGNEQRRYRR